VLTPRPTDHRDTIFPVGNCKEAKDGRGRRGGCGPKGRAQHAGGDGATPGHRRRMSARRKQAAVLRLRMATWPWPTSCSRPRSSGWRPPAPWVSGGRGDEPPGLALRRQGLRPGAGDPDPGRPRGDHLSSSPGAGCARETRAARRHVGPRRGRRDQAAPAGWPGHPERNFWAGGNKKPSVPCRRAAYMARPQRDDRPASVCVAHAPESRRRLPSAVGHCPSQRRRKALSVDASD
jgi:hypothetical protein